MRPEHSTEPNHKSAQKRDSGDMQKSQQLVLSQNLFCGLEIWVRPHRSKGVAMTRVGSRETHTTANETLEAIYRKCLSLTPLKSLSSGAGGRDYGCHSIRSGRCSCTALKQACGVLRAWAYEKDYTHSLQLYSVICSLFWKWGRSCSTVIGVGTNTWMSTRQKTWCKM